MVEGATPDTIVDVLHTFEASDAQAFQTLFDSEPTSPVELLSRSFTPEELAALSCPPSIERKLW